jgi:hypothetical protein
MKNIGEILDLNTKDPYNASTDSEGSFIQYQGKEDEPIRVLRMNKLEKREFTFSYCEIEKEEVKGLISIDLSPGEVRNI